MKKLIAHALFLSFAIAILLQSCRKAHPEKPSQTVNVSASIISGSWKISSFTQREESRTVTFQGYSFTFMEGGVVNAVKNGEMVSGKWSYQSSAVTYYGSTPSKASLTISLGSEQPLSRLNKVWNIDAVNTSSVKLALLSPEVAEQEQLTFSKQ